MLFAKLACILISATLLSGFSYEVTLEKSSEAIRSFENENKATVQVPTYSPFKPADVVTTFFEKGNQLSIMLTKDKEMINVIIHQYGKRQLPVDIGKLVLLNDGTEAVYHNDPNETEFLIFHKGSLEYGIINQKHNIGIGVKELTRIANSLK